MDQDFKLAHSAWLGSGFKNLNQNLIGAQNVPMLQAA
jgi:hypothetical protein